MENQAQPVIVLSASSIDSLYVKFSFHVQLENDLQESLQRNEFLPEIPSEIRIGQIYIANCEQHRDWYRVRVEKLGTNSQADVFYIDHGYTGQVHELSLRTCSKLWSSLPPMAIHCRLAIYQDLTTKQKDELKKLFNNIVTSREEHQLIVKQSTDDKFLSIDLVTINRGSNFSICDFILTISGIPVKCRIENIPKRIGSLKISDGSIVKIHKIDSPAEIYFSSLEFEMDEAVMQIEMTECYKNDQGVFTLLLPGVFCATKMLNKWHRVEVLQSPDNEGMCEVRFIDTGKVSVIKWNLLYELNGIFYNCPAYAIKYSLAGHSSIRQELTSKATAFLQQTLKPQHHQRLEIQHSTDGVTLFVILNENRMNINKVMFKILDEDLSPLPEMPPPQEEVNFSLVNLECDQPNITMHQVDILDRTNINPSSFRVLLKEYAGKVSLMTDQIQNQISSLRRKCVWRVGEICIAKSKRDRKWIRGMITSTEGGIGFLVQFDDGTESRVDHSFLRECPEQFTDFKSPVAWVKVPYAFKKNFNADDQKNFRKLMDFKHFYISFVDDTESQVASIKKPREVILYGRRLTEKKENVLERLVQAGLAVPQPCMIETDAARSSEQLMELDMPEITVCSYIIKLERRIIESWLGTIPIDMEKFDAIGTQVDVHGNVLLYERFHFPEIKKINDIIQRHVREPPFAPFTFKIGDACLVPYNFDNLYYRGKVVELNGSNCSVEFVDYGNIQHNVNIAVLHKEVLCYEIPLFINKYRLEGSALTADGEIDLILLDKLHALISEQRLVVTVLPSSSPSLDKSSPKLCWINVGGICLKKIRDAELYMDLVEIK